MNRKSFLFFTCVFIIAFFSVNCKPLETCSSDSSCNKHKEKMFKSNKLTCDFCELFLPVLRDYVKENKTELISQLAVFACDVARIVDNVVCHQIIDLFKNSVIAVVRDSPMTSSELCSLGLGCSNIFNPVLNWNITLPSVPKPPVKPLTPPNPGSPTIRILQLSDIHIDFEYQPGAIAECGQPLCCRNSSTYKNNKNNDAEPLAGYWGDYRNCDVPLWTVENMFEYISKNEDFDFVYWTGDLPPHNVWNQTRSDQLYALEQLTRLFKKYFPDKLIFPTLGNHEAAPCNLFPTPYIKEDNIGWLYNALAEQWTQTGIPYSMKHNISTGAFYTIKLFDKLRLISLNTNYCPKENFWLLVNSTDPLDQLKWLAETLQYSEDNNEIVHIIGHIHPVNCLDSWSNNYYRIVNRYESTIATQIFGHDHTDSFRIFYDLKNLSRPISISYLGPSVTTKSYLNPGYRIYEVDGDYDGSSWYVLDHYTKIFNLTEANLLNYPKYSQEYSAKEAFNLESLFPENWDNLVNIMMEDFNGNLVDKLIRYFYKSSDAKKNCDLKCRKKLLCNLKRARSDHLLPC